MVYILGARLVDLCMVVGLGQKSGVWENGVVILWRNIGVGREQIPRMRYMFHEYHFTDLIKKLK